jgi:hypothetical protein
VPYLTYLLGSQVKKPSPKALHTALLCWVLGTICGHCWCLTLSLLMSCIYGAPSKARNLMYVYICVCVYIYIYIQGVPGGM